VFLSKIDESKKTVTKTYKTNQNTNKKVHDSRVYYLPLKISRVNLQKVFSLLFKDYLKINKLQH